MTALLYAHLALRSPKATILLVFLLSRDPVLLSSAATPARATGKPTVYLSLALALAGTIMVPGKEALGRGTHGRESGAALRGASGRCWHERDHRIHAERKASEY